MPVVRARDSPRHEHLWHEPHSPPFQNLAHGGPLVLEPIFKRHQICTIDRILNLSVDTDPARLLSRQFLKLAADLRPTGRVGQSRQKEGSDTGVKELDENIQRA